MAEIIRIAKVGALKTQIMYKANLSFVQLGEYLRLLTHKNLLEKTAYDGKEIYRATQKGVSFTERQNALSALLN
jgi:predicted transcriptional regulator